MNGTDYCAKIKGSTGCKNSFPDGFGNFSCGCENGLFWHYYQLK